jgi:hypothetical protein
LLSVITPTMWYYPPFINLLEKVLDLDCVGEVIIINNNMDLTPQSNILKHKKIVMHNSIKNLYVNPSWNLGAKLANYEHLCFLSDDVDVNIDIFEKTDEFLKDDGVGMVATLVEEEESLEVYKRLYLDNTITFTSCREQDNSLRAPPIGIGVIFFMKKTDFEPVTEEIKIFHGEVIHWNRLYKNKNNYMITNCYVYTPHHVSWKKIAEYDAENFNDIQISDNIVTEQLISEMSEEKNI